MASQLKEGRSALRLARARVKARSSQMKQHGVQQLQRFSGRMQVRAIRPIEYASHWVTLPTLRQFAYWTHGIRLPQAAFAESDIAASIWF
jgi:hypothetical protein